MFWECYNIISVLWIPLQHSVSHHHDKRMEEIFSAELLSMVACAVFCADTLSCKKSKKRRIWVKTMLTMALSVVVRVLATRLHLMEFFAW